MLYGTPHRREHRPAPDGALALFVRTFAGAGQHRPPARRRARREPERAAQFLVEGLAGLILLGLVAMTTFLMLAGQRHDATTGQPVVRDGLVGPGSADTGPLTMSEVFPDRTEVRPAASRPYRISLTHSDRNCRTATTGELGSLLAGHGCSQVVRAGMVAPYGG
jgi:hypothetical protein